MEFKLETAALSKVTADAIVVGVFEDEDADKVLSRLDKSIPSQWLSKLREFALSEGFKGKSGQSLKLPSFGHLKCKKVVLWGSGKSTDYDASATRKMAANIARRMTSESAVASLCLHLRPRADAREHVRAAVEGFILGGYTFTKYKSKSEDKSRRAPLRATISGAKLPAKEFAHAVTLGQVVAHAQNLARDWIAEPPAYMTPTRMAQEARKIARERSLTLTVMTAEQVEKMGMGAFLGVARGAKEPLRLVVLKYKPARAKRTVAIVGKGITFDSGGLSLKTAQGMEYMKYDMSGAAAVIATMGAIAQAKPLVTVVGIAALTENMPGGAALHPGDVLTAMNGKTIEVNNTDAEGRLILADALCYALKEKPDEIIDIATLTGAVTTALGRVAAGIMGNDQKLIDRLIKCGSESGEKMWQLPMFDEYKEGLKSDIADLKNAGSRGEAGSSSAAMFLREFVDGRPWAHLDIAGVGWKEKEKDENNKGGTAFGVRTLCRFLIG